MTLSSKSSPPDPSAPSGNKRSNPASSLSDPASSPKKLKSSGPDLVSLLAECRKTCEDLNLPEEQMYVKMWAALEKDAVNNPYYGAGELRGEIYDPSKPLEKGYAWGSFSPGDDEARSFVYMMHCLECGQMKDHLTKDCPHKGSKSIDVQNLIFIGESSGHETEPETK